MSCLHFSPFLLARFALPHLQVTYVGPFRAYRISFTLTKTQARFGFFDPHLHKCVCSRTAISFDADKPYTSYRLSVVMITRLMINLRDPTIHSLIDRDGTVTTSHVGYVSTLVLGDTYSSMLATQTKTIPSSHAAWFVVFSWSHSYHVDLIL